MRVRRELAVSLLGALTVWLVASSASLSAHHGTNQSYDRTTSVTVKGVVASLSYRNPHPALFVDVKKDDGSVARWTFEIAPTPYTLALRGWTKSRSEEALKPGTPVTITMSPSKAGTPIGLMRSIVNEAGEDILGGGGAEAR
jgi:hypothetical protein